MGTTVMEFSREAGNYVTYVTQGEGDDLGFETTQTPSFPSNTKVTSVDFYIAKGLKSGSGNLRSCELGVEFYCNDSWCQVWSGSKTLSGDGGDGTVPSFTISIPSEYQRDFAVYGIDEVRITQEGSYSLKGMSTAHGTATFTYGTYYSRCERPSTVTVSASSTMNSTVSLSWAGAKAGVNNAISGYMVEYADSADNASWGGWTYLNTFSSSPQTVNTPAVGYYRKYRVWTLGSVGSDYNSSSARESSSVLRLKTVTRCTAPKTVTIEKSVSAASTNKLSWSGASGGTNNSISGYFIQYADSKDNKTWGSWGGDFSVGVVSNTSVPMPSENMYRKYRVYTLGSAGSNWRSSSATESGSTYRGHAELAGFTDSPLVAGQTRVKALHMQELQDRVNTLRGFYGLSAYSFTTIKSGSTQLKDWTAHVKEIRTAIDGISTKHDTWITISANCPRADVIEQLRTVILAM